MEVTAELIEHLGDLSRLDLAPAEIATLTRQLHDILHYMAQLGRLDAALHVAQDMPGMALREDVAGAIGDLAWVARNAPAWEAGHVAVPAVLPPEDGS
jgi:aspartyl/glutamyl-tRNA(Asn/Gln) amidotransferase C subunit